MVDESHAPATGCSIDKSVALMKNIEEEFKINLFDRFDIAWRDKDQIRSHNREDFEKSILKGDVHADTIVFNNLIQTVGELETKWEVPFKDSWHMSLFGGLINDRVI
jgi:hypothetical protein